MNIISKEALEELRNTYRAGARVVLKKMDDAMAPPIGTEGTVIGVDDIGTVFVSWDNGSSLGVVYGEDRIRKANNNG